MRGILTVLALALPAGWIAGSAPGAAAQIAANGKRLILKDGSYQIVAKYEVHGDRVRYLSAERDDWEEIPYALIDWTATNKWNKEHEPGAAATAAGQPAAPGNGQPGATDEGEKEAAAIDAAAAAERADLRSRTPQVAPGLNLPDESGIFVLDYYQGIPELVRLGQTVGMVSGGTSHSVLRAAIDSFHGSQEPVRINGQAAPVRLHVDVPALYVSLDTRAEEEVEPEAALVVDTHGASSTADKNDYSSPDSRYAIVRVDVRPGERVIGAVRITRAGEARQSEDIVPTTATILPGRHWMKLTPKEPLTIGDYALMEILGPGQVNLDVWDFGVSPNAPENRHPLTPIKDDSP